MCAILIITSFQGSQQVLPHRGGDILKKVFPDFSTALVSSPLRAKRMTSRALNC